MTGTYCHKCDPLLSLAMLHDDRLRSVVAHEESCREGDTDPDDRLEGEGGVGDAPPPWCCHGTEPGGDKVTGTTFLTTTDTSMWRQASGQKRLTFRIGLVHRLSYLFEQVLGLGLFRFLVQVVGRIGQAVAADPLFSLRQHLEVHRLII